MYIYIDTSIALEAPHRPSITCFCSLGAGKGAPVRSAKRPGPGFGGTVAEQTSGRDGHDGKIYVSSRPGKIFREGSSDCSGLSLYCPGQALASTHTAPSLQRLVGVLRGQQCHASSV